MNVIDWMRSTAEWMHKDRPDTYPSPLVAFQGLDLWMDDLRKEPHVKCTIETGGYALTRTYDDGVEEFSLAKVITSVAIYEEEEVVDGYHWLKDSGVVSVYPNIRALEDFDDEDA
jgi:hypothetical protein